MSNSTPAIRRYGKRKIDAIIVICIVCCSLALLLLFALLFRLDSSSLTVPTEPWRQQYPDQGDLHDGYALAEKFLSDVQAGRLDAAYGAYTAVYNRDMSRDEFEAYIRKQPGLKEPIPRLKGEVWESRPFGNYKYECEAPSRDGRRVWVEIWLSSERGPLAIRNFAVEATGQ